MFDRIDESQWEWYGNAMHFICGQSCRFHMGTKIGSFIISTVGEYLPDSQVRDILAMSRNKPLVGNGDAREADWMNKHGYEDIGLDRKYETMVFKASGKTCECGCFLPQIIPSELDFEGYNDPKSATAGHRAMCQQWALADTQEMGNAKLLEREQDRLEYKQEKDNAGTE
jgi:hypothetical protein